MSNGIFGSSFEKIYVSDSPIYACVSRASGSRKESAAKEFCARGVLIGCDGIESAQALVGFTRSTKRVLP